MSASSAERLDALLSALDRLPPSRGLSYRGYAGRQGEGFQRPQVSAVVVVATGRDPLVATENLSTDGLYAVIGGRGRDIASLGCQSHEQEIVFRPGSVFLPIERFDVDDLEVAIVEEIDPDRDRDEQPPFTLEQLKDQLRAAIRDAHERNAVGRVTPGKYVGPLR